MHAHTENWVPTNNHMSLSTQDDPQQRDIQLAQYSEWVSEQRFNVPLDTL